MSVTLSTCMIHGATNCLWYTCLIVRVVNLMLLIARRCTAIYLMYFMALKLEVCRVTISSTCEVYFIRYIYRCPLRCWDIYHAVYILHGSDDAVGSGLRARTQGSPYVAVLWSSRMGSASDRRSHVVGHVHGRQQPGTSSSGHRRQRVERQDREHLQSLALWTSWIR